MELFVIDTDQYSGNFERNMCAFLTGVVGDCCVGTEMTGNYPEVEGVLQQPDDHGTMRPCSTYETPGYYNNGLGFNFKAGQEDEALEKYKSYVREDEAKWIEIEEGHRGKNVYTWTDEAIDNSIARRRKAIAEAEAKTELFKYPASQSVVIYFEDGALTLEIIDELKARAIEYVKTYSISRWNKTRITIEGFRHIRKEVKIIETSNYV